MSTPDELGDVRKFLDDAAADVPGPDAPLGEIAVSRGFCTDAQLEECLEEQRRTTPHVLLGELLLRRKYISGEQLLRALACQKKPAPPPQIPEGAKIGRYSLLREIGRGGMGVVYEAEDPDLRRRVALKVLKEGAADPTAAERLRREAAIIAQLRHTGIVTIHEVGETKPSSGPSLPFIAMDFIEGRTLADLLEDKATPRAELLRILEDVARAVAHAHAAGVVHRDLKPANVLVENTGRAVLGDFGIARAESFQTRLTESRFVVGTPEYMSPEQAEDRADQIGPASDIHALGVMLYEILTGRLPWRADTPLGVLRKIMTEEAVSPRLLVPSVEADLEIICLKALEKEGSRRYRTADAFADDLVRFRDGRPILARPTGPIPRMWRRVVRRKRTAAVSAAAALVVLAIVLTLGVWARSERREAVRQLNERMETSLRAALELRRAGDLTRMKAFAREAQETCTAASARHPDLAEPHALLGRMHRALLDFDRALEEQELALSRDPRCARALYERIVLTSRLLRRREDELVERAWRGLGEKLVKERAGKVYAEEVVVPSRDQLTKGDPAARELKERVHEDLRKLDGLEAGGISAGELACAKGLAGRSRAALQEALAQAPYLQEAVEALATLEQDEGNFEKAIAVWSGGLENDKGCLTHLEGRGEARLNGGYRKWLKGEDPADLFIAAVGDFTKALELDPRRDGALRERGLAHFLLGISIGWGRLDDAMRQFQAAVDDLGRALALNPKAAPTWMWRGVVRSTLAIGKMLQLEDPAALCGEAIADLTEAIRRNPQGDEPYLWRALARVPWAVQRALKREDPEPLYREALTDFEQALRLNPGRGETWLWRATIQTAWANYLTAHGREGTDILRRAAADLDIAIQKLPERTEAVERRGQIELTLAATPGEDAPARSRAAVGFFETALARNPKSATALSGRGEARLRLSVEMARRGENPVSTFEAAFRDLDEAAKRDPPARILRAEAYVHRGEWRTAAGKDADSDYQAALADTKAAIEANPLATDAWIWQGRARTLQAALRPVPMIHYAEAIGDFNKVLFFNADHLQALRFRGEAYQRRAALKASRRLLDAGADYQSALTDFEHVVRLQPTGERELRDAIAACKAGIEGKR